jgi:molybdate transport system substrate-binding protein
MRSGWRRRRVLLAVFLTWILGWVAALPASPALAQERAVVVFAAASLKTALDEIVAAWSKETGRSAVASYGPSNGLAKQIEAGAPADVFISADLDWMDYAQRKGLVRPETRINLLANALVLVSPQNSAAALDPQHGFGPALATALAGGRLAVGNVDAVPAGKYAKAALQTLGAWPEVKDRLAQAESVRAALLLVSRGEAPLGIVYRTDAVADPGVRVVATFPEGSHPPVVYPVALTSGTMNPAAAPFLSYLTSPTARIAFERQGFVVLAKAASGS